MAVARTGSRVDACGIGSMGSDGNLQHRTEVFDGAIASGEVLASKGVLTIPGECQITEIRVARSHAVGGGIVYRDLAPGGTTPAWTAYSQTYSSAATEVRVGTKADNLHFQETTTPREFGFQASGAQADTECRVVLSITFSNI